MSERLTEYLASVEQLRVLKERGVDLWTAMTRDEHLLAYEGERDEARKALRRCVDEFVHRAWGETRTGNAPGHAHLTPGIWDDDNGTKAGTLCEWCAAWPKILALAGARGAGSGGER